LAKGGPVAAIAALEELRNSYPSAKEERGEEKGSKKKMYHKANGRKPFGSWKGSAWGKKKIL